MNEKKNSTLSSFLSRATYGGKLEFDLNRNLYFSKLEEDAEKIKLGTPIYKTSLENIKFKKEKEVSLKIFEPQFDENLFISSEKKVYIKLNIKQVEKNHYLQIKLDNYLAEIEQSVPRPSADIKKLRNENPALKSIVYEFLGNIEEILNENLGSGKKVQISAQVKKIENTMYSIAIDTEGLRYLNGLMDTSNYMVEGISSQIEFNKTKLTERVSMLSDLFFYTNKKILHHAAKGNAKDVEKFTAINVRTLCYYW